MNQQPLKQMHKEYKEEYAKRCGQCCNYRSAEGGACIAYGVEYCDGWSVDWRACGLYNIPFTALRPRKMELGEYLDSRKRKKPDRTGDDSQLTIF